MLSGQHFNNDVLETGKFILDELDYFAEKFEPRSYNGDVDILSEQHFKAIATIKAAEQALLKEPFVAFAHATNQSKKVFLLICRHYPPTSLKPCNSDAEYASYLSPMGQLASQSLGGQIRGWQLEKKAEFTPMQIGQNKWDAVNCLAFFRSGSQLIGSLRKLFGIEKRCPVDSEGKNKGSISDIRSNLGAAAYVTELAPSSLGIRALRYKVELPSRAVLDAVQDEIFRLPLNRFVRISGAPGTGKTTVLIKRLSQKTKKEFLSKDELDIVKRGSSAEFVGKNT